MIIYVTQIPKSGYDCFIIRIIGIFETKIFI